MKEIITCPLLLILLNLPLYIQAQTENEADSLRIPTQQIIKKGHQRNFVKLNLTSLALKNYSVQYERVINKTISLAISFRTMPGTTLPFKNKILQIIGDEDKETAEILNSLQLSNFAFTPEMRIYVGRKGYGRGFYIAPFYRYASFKVDQFIFNYENSLGEENNISLSGKLTANT